MATAITNIQATLNAGVVSTQTIATADVADTAEVFSITLTKPRAIVQVSENGVSGSVTFSLASDNPLGGTALTGTIVQGTAQVLEVDTAKYESETGVMTLTVTPASGKKLLTDHALTIQVVQLV